MTLTYLNSIYRGGGPLYKCSNQEMVYAKNTCILGTPDPDPPLHQERVNNGALGESDPPPSSYIDTRVPTKKGLMF